MEKEKDREGDNICETNKKGAEESKSSIEESVGGNQKTSR